MRRLCAFAAFALLLLPAPAGALTLEDLVGGASFTTDNDLTFSDFEVVLYDYELDLAATEVVQLSDGFELTFAWEGLDPTAGAGFDLAFTVSTDVLRKKAASKKATEIIELFAENDQDGTLPFSESGSIVFPDDPFITEASATLQGELVGPGSVDVLTGPASLRKKARKKKATTDETTTAGGIVDDEPVVFAEYAADVYLAGGGEATLSHHLTAADLEAAIPEPGGALLFAAGAGVVGLGVRRQRRR